MPDLEEQLKAWTDQTDPISADEARTRATEPTLPLAPRRPPGASGLLGSPSRRLLAAAAVVTLVIAGLVVMTQAGDSNEVQIGEQPQQPAPTPTAPAPTDGPAEPEEVIDELPMDQLSLDGPIPPADFEGPPPFWLGHDENHRLVAVDTATGRVLQVVGQFDDADRFESSVAPEPIATGGFLGAFSLAPDRQSAFVEVCCEPVSGTIIRMPLEGDHAPISDLIESRVSYGYEMVFSPDGTRVAIIGYESLRVVDLTTRESWVFPHEEPGLATVVDVAWSLDGGSVVAAWPVTIDDGSQHHEVRLLELGRTESFETALALHRTATDIVVTDLSVDTDGNVHVATRPSAGPGVPGDHDWTGPATVRVVDPATADVIEEVEYQGTVVSQHHGAGGTWTLLLDEQGLQDSATSPAVVVVHDGEMVSSHAGYHQATW